MNLSENSRRYSQVEVHHPLNVKEKLGQNLCASLPTVSNQRGRKYSNRSKLRKGSQRKNERGKIKWRKIEGETLGHTFSFRLSLSRAEALVVFYLYEYRNVKLKMKK